MNAPARKAAEQGDVTSDELMTEFPLWLLLCGA